MSPYIHRGVAYCDLYACSSFAAGLIYGDSLALTDHNFHSPHRVLKVNRVEWDFTEELNKETEEFQCQKIIYTDATSY